MHKSIMTLAIASMALPAAPAFAQYNSPEREYHRNVTEAQRDYQNDLRRAQREYRDDRRDDRREFRRDWRNHNRDWRRYRTYDWNRPDPYFGHYYPDYYYRSGTYYRPYRMGRDDRIYRGNDGRYYCRRSDGTTGLVVGAVIGGAIGNSLGRGDSRVLGTILGGSAGALLGRELDRGSVSCR